MSWIQQWLIASYYVSVTTWFIYAYWGQTTWGNVLTNYQYDIWANTWSAKTSLWWVMRSMGCYTIWTDKCYSAYWYNGAFTSWNNEYSQTWNSWISKTAWTSNKGDMCSASLWLFWYCIAGSDWSTNQNTNYEYSQSWNSWATKTASNQTSRWLWNGTNIWTDKIYQSCWFTTWVSNVTTEYSQTWNSWTSKTARTQSRYDWCFTTIKNSNFAYWNWWYNGTTNDTTNSQYSQTWNSWATKTACTTWTYAPWWTVVDTDKCAVLWWSNLWANPWFDINLHYSEAGNSWATKQVMTWPKMNFQWTTI